MTEKEIKDIVSATIEELANRKMLSEDDDLNYQFIGSELRKYYCTGKSSRIAAALDAVKDDPYFKIIPAYYQRGRSLVWIAVDIGCDRVTVARNKKRLALEIYRKYCETA